MSNTQIDLASLANDIASMTLDDIPQFMELLGKKLNLSMEDIMRFMMSGGSSNNEESEGDSSTSTSAQQSDFIVFIGQIDEGKRIPIIKAIREIRSDLSLGAAREVLERVVKGDGDLNPGHKYKKEEAEKHKEKLEAAGATVVLK